MFARTMGYGFVISVAVGLTVPTAARADEYRITLEGHLQVAVGPPGPGITVRRQRVEGRRFVTISAPATSTTSHCGGALQRVTVWERQTDRTWIESLSDTWEPCVRVGNALQRRTVNVNVVSGTEAQIVLSLPHQPQVSDTIVRYARMGDRFVGPHRAREVASAPEEPAHGAITQAPEGATDGDLREWQGRTPVVSTRDTKLWLGMEGRTLRFAAHLPPDATPVVSLALAEPGVSTDVLLSSTDNRGRFFTVRCDEAPPQDAVVQCHHTPDGTTIEGSTDLGTMVWATQSIASVAVYAQAGDGATRVTSDPSARLHPYTLANPIELLDHVSPSALAACAGTRLHTWVPSYSASGVAGMRVLACGDHCADGDCERHTLGDTIPRVALSRDGASFCTSLTGVGAERVHTCGPDGDRARLVGNFPLMGFTTVVAIDRQMGPGTGGSHRPEVWALVSPSAAWQEIWQGRDRSSTDTLHVDIQEQHPRFCTEARACEVADGITLVPPDPGPVTVSFSRLARASGLQQPPRF